MCFGSAPKVPPPVMPPPPPEPSATELEEPAAQRKKRGGPSTLESLRIPLNPTGQAGGPRLGL